MPRLVYTHDTIPCTARHPPKLMKRVPPLRDAVSDATNAATQLPALPMAPVRLVEPIARRSPVELGLATRITTASGKRPERRGLGTRSPSPPLPAQTSPDAAASKAPVVMPSVRLAATAPAGALVPSLPPGPPPPPPSGPPPSGPPPPPLGAAAGAATARPAMVARPPTVPKSGSSSARRCGAADHYHTGTMQGKLCHTPRGAPPSRCGGVDERCSSASQHPTPSRGATPAAGPSRGATPAAAAAGCVAAAPSHKAPVCRAAALTPDVLEVEHAGGRAGRLAPEPEPWPAAEREVHEPDPEPPLAPLAPGVGTSFFGHEVAPAMDSAPPHAARDMGLSGAGPSGAGPSGAGPSGAGPSGVGMYGGTGPSGFGLYGDSDAEATDDEGADDDDLQFEWQRHGDDYFDLATAPVLRARPPPQTGAAGAIVKSDEQLINDKERDLEAWMLRFVKANGLTEIFESKPDEDFARHDLKQEIAGGTSALSALGRKAGEMDKAQEEIAHMIDEQMMNVMGMSHDATAYVGRSVSTRQRMWDGLSSQMDKVTASLSASIAAEYRSAWSEGRRDLHCEQLLEMQDELYTRFGEEVDLDLGDVLAERPTLSPQFNASQIDWAARQQAGPAPPTPRRRSPKARRKKKAAAAADAADADAPEGGAGAAPAAELPPIGDSAWSDSEQATSPPVTREGLHALEAERSPGAEGGLGAPDVPPPSEDGAEVANGRAREFPPPADVPAAAGAAGGPAAVADGEPAPLA